jgi:SAM-dependent methyltransferase
MDVHSSPVLEHVSCSLCGANHANHYDVVYQAQYDREKDPDPADKFRASGDELLIDQLVRCRICGLQYVNPRLREDLILSGYEAGHDSIYVSQVEARELTFATALDEIERAADGRGRLLDIGTAAGSFVAAARDRGWEAEGCEPNHWLTDWGTRRYGVQIRQGDVLNLDYEERSFDVITLWDVIEHTPNPPEVLQRCRALLRPGGILVVNYPDIGSWIARIMGRRWLFLSSVHLYYFDRRTIRLMLEKTGYRIETVRPHFQRLELDYILYRGSRLSQAMSSRARRIAQALKIGRAKVPYWLGQTFVLGRKHSAILWPLGVEL